MEVKMKRVISSNIYAVGYRNKKLYVQFHKNGVPTDTYVYESVPEAMHSNMIASPSIGSYFAHYIKGNFVTRKL